MTMNGWLCNYFSNLDGFWSSFQLCCNYNLFHHSNKMIFHDVFVFFITLYIGLVAHHYYKNMLFWLEIQSRKTPSRQMLKISFCQFGQVNLDLFCMIGVVFFNWETIGWLDWSFWVLDSEPFDWSNFYPDFLGIITKFFLFV